jgi:hypothetical protein
MKLFFAAPLSGLPSDPIGLGSQASRLHFAMKLVFAAPASGLPSLDIALLSHVPGAGTCAAAEPIENAVSKTTSINRVIVCSMRETGNQPRRRRISPNHHMIGAPQKRTKMMRAAYARVCPALTSVFAASSHLLLISSSSSSVRCSRPMKDFCALLTRINSSSFTWMAAASRFCEF